jgi:hypothetical protein
MFTKNSLISLFSAFGGLAAIFVYSKNKDQVNNSPLQSPLIIENDKIDFSVKTETKKEVEAPKIDYSLPRGIRVNNPLNIREDKDGGDLWQGEAAYDFDASFEEFTSPEYGIRAAVRILRNYRSRGIKTLEQIIATWAPANENNVEAYVQSVSKKTGISRSTVITDGDFPALIAAMIYHENGQQPYAMSVINQGIALA